MNTPTLAEAVVFYMRYHPQKGPRALVELEMIKDLAGATLMTIGGESMRVIGRETIGARKVGDHYCEAVPVVIVERK